MTLKERFEKIKKEQQKEKDNFAIGFADWINLNAYKFPNKTTTKELLEIYKEKFVKPFFLLGYRLLKFNYM